MSNFYLLTSKVLDEDNKELLLNRFKLEDYRIHIVNQDDLYRNRIRPISTRDTAKTTNYSLRRDPYIPLTNQNNFFNNFSFPIGNLL